MYVAKPIDVRVKDTDAVMPAMVDLEFIPPTEIIGGGIDMD